MAEDLLPPGSSALERAVARALADMADIAVPIDTLWNPATCPAPLLPWLAWALSVDVWDSIWPESTKRAVIAASVEVHRHKGTPASVKRALAAAGFDGATLLEGLGRRKYDGSIAHDGRFFYGWAAAWAFYRVILDKPIANRQAAQVRAILEQTAPARSHLLSLDFIEVANIYDGRARYDGAYNHGVA